MKKQIVTFCLLAMSSIASATSIDAVDTSNKANVNIEITNTIKNHFCIYNNSVYSKGSIININGKERECRNSKDSGLFWKDSTKL